MAKEYFTVGELKEIHSNIGFLGTSPLELEFCIEDKANEQYENIDKVPKEYLDYDVVGIDLQKKDNRKKEYQLKMAVIGM